LVTNGEVKDPVKAEIRARGQGADGQGYRRLELINRGDLLRGFIDLHGKFLPTAPGDFERFLRLYLADKRGFLPKDEFSEFLLSALPSQTRMNKSQSRRVVAASAVLANYILDGYFKQGNNLALAEGWMLVLAHVLRIVESARPERKDWFPSAEMCAEGWERAVDALVQEALVSPNWIEGDATVDSFVFQHRKTVLIGYLASFALYRRLTKRPLQNENEIYVRVSEEIKPLRLWGESALPYFISVILFLWIRGSEGEADQLCVTLIQTISKLNGNLQEPGLPDPYLDGLGVLSQELSAKRALEVMQFVVFRDRSKNAMAPEEFYRSLASLAQNATGRPGWDVWQTFAGKSFGIRSFVEFLARRERKTSLKKLWFDITRVDYAEFVPANPPDFYLWRAREGCLVTRRFGRPESWENLVRRASTMPRRQNCLFKEFPKLLMPFALVYPQPIDSGLGSPMGAATQTL
jgi:hypothetical protein